MSIKQIFDEIAQESSTNKKMEILSKYKDNKLLEKVLYAALSKRVKYYIKQIPEYKQVSNFSLEEMLPHLDGLSKRILTGTMGIMHLQATLESLNPDDAYIIERIIDKDPKIGMGRTNVNKVFPSLVEKTPYMGAKPFSEELARKLFANSHLKKNYKGEISQIKMDGRYLNCIVRGGDVEAESRQGEPTSLEGANFLRELSTLGDCVLNGELTMRPREKKIIIKKTQSIDIDGVMISYDELLKKCSNFPLEI